MSFTAWKIQEWIRNLSRKKAVPRPVPDKRPRVEVPVAIPDITEDDVRLVTECAKSGWVSGISPWVEEFEEKFADYIGVPHALATGSGTTALHLASATIGLGQNEQVIMPSFTMIASANAVKYCGANPVFVDSDPETWCMDTSNEGRRILKNVSRGELKKGGDPNEVDIMGHTRAIMPVHVYGHPTDMARIMHIASQEKLFVIEDCAESHGAEVRGFGKTGAIGDMGCFSLYANKIITSGEGGLITFQHKELYKRAHWLRAHAFGRHGKHYWHEDIGYGYRMGGLQAALGMSQLSRIEDYIEKRRENAKLYMDLLGDYAKDQRILFPVEKPWAKNVYWMFSIMLTDQVTPRQEVMDHLASKGIETRTFFYPLHDMPPYKTHQTLPVARTISQYGMNLPSGNAVTEDQIHYVCEKLREIL